MQLLHVVATQLSDYVIKHYCLMRWTFSCCNLPLVYINITTYTKNSTLELHIIAQCAMHHRALL